MKRYKINNGLIVQKMSDKITIFDGEKSQLLSFNETASFIFGLLKKDCSEEKIVELVEKKYKIGKKQAKSDLQSLLVEMKRLGVIGK